MDSKIDHPLKHTFGYATGFIFLLGIMIYIYLLIMDHLEDPNQHSTEEMGWIYLFLCILVIGFILSYYSIICSVKTVEKSSSYEIYANKQGWRFGGIKRIPTKPSVGQHKVIHSSKFTV